MSRIDRLLEQYSRSVVLPNVQWLFMKVAYGFMLLLALYFFEIRNEVWGSGSLFREWNPGNTKALNLAYLLDHVRSAALPVYYLHLVLLALCLVGVGGRVLRVLVFLSSVMLYYAAIPLFNASALLYNLFAVYLVFFDPKARHPVNVFFTNLAFLACRLQFVLVYAIAGIYKLSGTTWMEGSSVYYALHLPHYTGVWLRDQLSEHRGFLIFSNYLGLCYQLAFPILVWWKRLRLPLFVVALSFHGFIAFGMNLYDFGIGMLAAYALFAGEEWVLRLRHWASGRLGRTKTTLE